MSRMMQSIRRLFGPSKAEAPKPLSDERNDDITALLRNRIDTAQAKHDAAFAQLRAAASEAHEVAMAAIRHLEDRGEGSRGRR